MTSKIQIAKQTYLLVENNSSTKCGEILFNGINEEAFRKKSMEPIRTFCFSMEDSQKKILAGVNGVVYYGCLYVDMLWVNSELRGKGCGLRLMQEAEAFGKKQGCSFATVNTMDWEALPFYQKLGYVIEFVREGYDKNSKMYMLRKAL